MGIPLPKSSRILNAAGAKANSENMWKSEGIKKCRGNNFWRFKMSKTWVYDLP